jgi:gliding motility-associated-like protein
VDYQLFPTAENDEQLVDFGAAATLNVLSNDNVPEDYQLFILSQPAHGQLDSSVFATGLITYTPFSGFTGTDVFFYRLRNLNCPESGSTGKVSITVSGAPDCIIYNVITPNSDGLNETFVIPAQCVLSGDGLLKIDLTIFNQWGDFVYRSEDYQNDWDGTRNGDPLPEGTYYYLIKEVGGITKDKATGFLLIKR